MSVDPMQGPKLRVKRAWKHYHDLHLAIDDFFATDPYPVSREPDPKRGGYRFRVRIRASVPPEIGIIFGDFVHNLRAALDNVVYESARLHNRNPRGTKWPFKKSRPTFDRLPMLKYLGPGAIQLIERYQPYNLSEANWQCAYLKALNGFWNRDKHRTTIPLALVSQYSSVVATAADLPNYVTYFGPIHDGKVIGWMPPNQPGMHHEPHFPIDIAFRRHEPVWTFFPHTLVVWQFVSDVIDSQVWSA